MPARYTTIKHAITNGLLSSGGKVIHSVLVVPGVTGTRTSFTIHDGTASGTVQNITVQSGSATDQSSPQAMFQGANFSKGVFAELVTGTGTVFVELS